MDALTGKTINKYTVQEKIGEGSHGAVYKASHPNIDHPVVLKMLLSKFKDNEEIMQRFASEADLIAHLNNHPNIVPIYDYWHDEGGSFLVLKWLDGGSLRDMLLNHGPLSLNQATYLMDKVASALTAAHDAGIIHRDIKPANIMFDLEGRVYLGDFGIAKRPDLKLTAPGAVLGTPAYLTPEQILAEPVGKQTDIYSLGVVLYESLTGQKPFTGQMAGQVMMQHLNKPVPLLEYDNPALTKAINEVIQKATAKKQADRYATVNDFAAAFRQAVAVLQN